MNEEYIPFYDNLNQKDKDFWLSCSKEVLIDRFIHSIRNGEELLSRIEKAIEYINTYVEDYDKRRISEEIDPQELIEILKGEDNE